MCNLQLYGLPDGSCSSGKIQAKELGKITSIIIEMPQEGFSRYTLEHTEPKPQEWRMKDYQIPTISLDLGTHLHNMIAF